MSLFSYIKVVVLMAKGEGREERRKKRRKELKIDAGRKLGKNMHKYMI